MFKLFYLFERWRKREMETSAGLSQMLETACAGSGRAKRWKLNPDLPWRCQGSSYLSQDSLVHQQGAGSGRDVRKPRPSEIGWGWSRWHPVCDAKCRPQVKDVEIKTARNLLKTSCIHRKCRNTEDCAFQINEKYVDKELKVTIKAEFFKNRLNIIWKNCSARVLLGTVGLTSGFHMVNFVSSFVKSHWHWQAQEWTLQRKGKLTLFIFSRKALPKKVTFSAILLHNIEDCLRSLTWFCKACELC